MQALAIGLRRSLSIQLRVIRALLLREVLTRYGRHNIGFLWLFAEPMLFTLGITALWTATHAVHGSNLPIVAFAITGYSSVLLWRNMPGRCADALKPNLALMYHRNVKVIDLFLARILLELAGATASFVVLTVLFWSLGMMNLPEDILKVVWGWAMLTWFGASLGILIGALAQRSELVEKIWHPTQYLLFPLSGAAFLVDAVPPAFQKVILWLPMVHGIELLREGFFGSVIKAHYDMGYMSAVCLGLTILGLAQTRYVSLHVAPE